MCRSVVLGTLLLMTAACPGAVSAGNVRGKGKKGKGCASVSADICRTNPSLSCCSMPNSQCLIYQTDLEDSTINNCVSFMTASDCVQPYATVTCTIAGAGDADLIVQLADKKKNYYVCSGAVNDSSNEDCEVVNQSYTARLVVDVCVFSPYSGVTLTCSSTDGP